MLPFVCLKPAGFCSAEQVAKSKQIYRRLFATKARHISLTDARKSDHSARQRKIWADWTNESMAESVRWTIASIVVLDSSFLRGALTALNWLAPPRVPQHVVGSVQEAIEVGRTLVRAEGLSPPADTWPALSRWLEQDARVAV
jgi:hypothetical protein